jgi:hypothetical protein
MAGPDEPSNVDVPPPHPMNFGHLPRLVEPVLDDYGQPKDVRIGLWGSPRAGKTTYLGALRIATQHPVDGYRWAISGRNPASTKFIIEMGTRLVSRREFPPASQGVSDLEWNFEALQIGRGGWFADLLRRLGDTGPRRADVDFVVRLQDASGEAYGEQAAPQHAEDVLGHLAESKGIVYLFDPLGHSEEENSSFEYFFAALERLTERMRERGLLEGGMLPHYVSVCVTKFDDPFLFNAAMDAQLISQEHDGAMPKVPSEIASDFLESVCADDSVRFVCDDLKSRFLPDRVRYFAASSIGFRLGSDGRFDINDFANVTEDGKIRTAPKPINVLEPIISLHRRICGRADLP